MDLGAGLAADPVAQTPTPAPRRSRASMSTSPLAQPKSVIHALASRVQDYLYFPTPDPLYVVLGTVAANMLSGAPVWVMLVGVPSSGRTIMLETLADVPRVHIVGAIKGPSALLSGTGQKDKSKTATGGILRQIGSCGMLVMKDFTSMLSLPREPLGEAIGALREIYDGRWSRPLGTDGGKILEWKGRVGFLGACTPAIDRHYSVTGELGERWVYYRYPDTDGYGETIKALGNAQPGEMMNELRTLVSMFVEGLGLAWEEGGTPRRDLTTHEKNRLYAISAFTVAARSPVPRDSRSHEVIDITQREAPTRLSGALGQLFLGLEMIGLEADEAWGIIGKMALDSAPQMRTKTIGALRIVGNEGVMLKSLREVLRCSTRTVNIVVEDLMLHGIVEKKPTQKVDRMNPDEHVATSMVRLTPWAKKHLDVGWGGK